ncbi:MAG: DUF1646 family protein [Elusimicrobiota bacterium]|nr:DUF1646 family protein [Elusimicrobiota bacterium]
MEPLNLTILIGLAVVVTLTLILPFSVKKVEEELEIFLFIMGVSAVTISGLWSGHLVKEALQEPIMISLAVLIIGFVFKNIRKYLKGWLNWLIAKVGIKPAIFFIVMFLGLGSSIMTAIIAALVLAEVISILRFRKKEEIRIVVYACFAIGLGAALTPIGEPLSTIAIAKLKGEPHNASFFFLFEHLGLWIIPGVIVSATMATLSAGGRIVKEAESLVEDVVETNKTIIFRAGKIYAFVMALIFLGSGLSPVTERYITKIPDHLLYWVNSISAILDNATLAAAEIVPSMGLNQITFLLMGLLLAGGLLIPGNIPNIVSASKLNIKSGQWAKVALPYGLVLMVVYFVLMLLILG